MIIVTVTVFDIFLGQNGWGTVRERSEFFRNGEKQNGTGTKELL